MKRSILLKALVVCGMGGYMLLSSSRLAHAIPITCQGTIAGSPCPYDLEGWCRASGKAQCLDLDPAYPFCNTTENGNSIVYCGPEES